MKYGQEIKIIRYDPNRDPEHFSRLENAYLELFNQKDNLRFLSPSDIPFDSNTISAFLKNAPSEDVEYYVAISYDDDIIGLSAFRNDSIKGFEIIGAVVHENHRLKGIGKELMDKGIDVAKKKGFKAVDISVFADNKAMLILLIKMDFKPIQIENHSRFDGEDLIHLKRYL
jgi:ribosomal protein S18 acetylase RimI-like enzyme